MGRVIDKFSIMRQVTANRQIEKDFKELSNGVKDKCVKPIFCIGTSNPDAITDQARDSISRKMKEYHVLMYYDPCIDGMKFEAFHEKPITGMQFEELKELVLKTLKYGTTSRN